MAIVFCCASAAPAINEAATDIAAIALIVARVMSRLLYRPCFVALVSWPLFTDLVRSLRRQPASCTVLAAKPPRSPDQGAPDGARRSLTSSRPRLPTGLETPVEVRRTAREFARSRCSVAAPSSAPRQQAHRGR